MVVRPSRLPKALGLALILAFWAWNFFGSQRELKQARSQWQALQARKAELEERVRELRREVHSLKYEKESQARAARQLLGVASPGEMVVIVPNFPEAKQKVQ